MGAIPHPRLLWVLLVPGPLSVVGQVLLYEGSVGVLQGFYRTGFYKGSTSVPYPTDSCSKGTS